MSITEITKLYNKFIDEIVEETMLYQDGEINKDHYENFLYKLPEMWKSGEKSCRSAFVISVIENIFKMEIPRKIKLSLISLDIKINSLDELLDNENLSYGNKASFVISNLYSDISLYNMANEIFVENYKKYISAILAVPVMEKRTYNKIVKCSHEEEKKYIKKSYSYRAQDISIFIKLPSELLELKLIGCLEKEFYRYRKSRLAIGDLKDFEEDLENNEYKPTTALFKKGYTYDEIEDKINSIKEDFEKKVCVGFQQML